MTTITLKREKPPFTLDKETFFCDNCQRYRKDFFKSYIQRRWRVCRVCVSNRRKTRHVDPITALRLKLYKHLHAKGCRQLARSISNSHVHTILKSHKVPDPKRVKRIVSPPKTKDEMEMNDLDLYQVELVEN